MKKKKTSPSRRDSGDLSKGSRLIEEVTHKEDSSSSSSEDKGRKLQIQEEYHPPQYSDDEPENPDVTEVPETVYSGDESQSKPEEPEEPEVTEVPETVYSEDEEMKYSE